jgi:steroid 5-alpha reductase family enzyme
MTPLHLVIVTSLIACALCWLASLITGDTSWVDRIWSIIPVVYLWEFAGKAHLQNFRLNVMAILVTIWGARLTFNFARKGGYSGVEDYRWQVLRDAMSKWQFQLFNLFFIVLYQNFLLVLISLPALTAFNHQSRGFTRWDLLWAVLFFLFTLGETIADQHQWNFHKWKGAEISAGRKPDPQFMQSGLFKFSRHPNYFFEVGQWWILFLFSAVAAGSINQWTIIGAIFLTLLFMGSTSFTEKITLSKYPEYAEFQKRVSAVIPWRPKSK